MANLQFNADQYEPSQEREVVPINKYKSTLLESEIVPTKDGKGKRLNLTFGILSGPYTGRKIFEGLNIVNKSQAAVDIAMSQLASLCLAVGKPTIRDTAELHNIPLMLSVGVQAANGQFKARNTVEGYKSIAEDRQQEMALAGDPDDDLPGKLNSADAANHSVDLSDNSRPGWNR